MDNSEVERFLKYVVKGTYTIVDGKACVDGDVKLDSFPAERAGWIISFTALPIQFSSVSGNFDCNAYHALETLEGMPSYVGGNFNCSSTNVKSLEGSPEFVGGSFSCNSMRIVSLSGAPKHIRGTLDCSDNGELKTLDGSPSEVGGSFDCSSTGITSLKGAPASVGGSFICQYCEELTTLHGGPQGVCDGYILTGNLKLSSLAGSPELVGGDFLCNGCKALGNLAGCSTSVGGDFNCSETKLETLIGGPSCVCKEYVACRIPSLLSVDGLAEVIGGKFSTVDTPIGCVLKDSKLKKALDWSKEAVTIVKRRADKWVLTLASTGEASNLNLEQVSILKKYPVFSELLRSAPLDYSDELVTNFKLSLALKMCVGGSSLKLLEKGGARVGASGYSASVPVQLTKEDVETLKHIPAFQPYQPTVVVPVCGISL